MTKIMALAAHLHKKKVGNNFSPYSLSSSTVCEEF